MAPSTHRWLRRALAVIGALVALLVLAAGAGLLWLRSASGRRALARRIERAVSAEIRGSLRIGSIEAVRWDGVRATGVRFVSPAGEPVIVVDAVDLDLRWRSALRGQFHSTHARASGGRVVLRDDAHGPLSIDVTFRGRPAPGGAPSAGDAGSHLAFDRIDVRGVTLVGALAAMPAFEVRHIRCQLALREVPPHGELALRIDDLHAAAHLETPVGIDLRFTGGTFRLDTGSVDRASAALRAELGSSAVRLDARAVMRGDDPLVRVHLAMPRGATVLDGLSTIVQASAAGAASPNFDFEVTHD